MSQYQSRAALKGAAREKLSGKYGSSMLVTLVIPMLLLLSIVFPLFTFFFTPLSFMVLSGAEITMANALPVYIATSAFSFICQVFIGVLNTGTNLFFLNIACGMKHSISDLFYGFRKQFKKSIGFAALTMLIYNICTLPYQICTFMYDFNPQLKWLVGALIFYVIALIIYLPIQLMLSQTLYLLLDFPQYSLKELVLLSVKVMQGNKKRLFLLQLSFLPLELLCICSFGIGYLWLYPYMLMTHTLFFLDLMKPKQTAEA